MTTVTMSVGRTGETTPRVTLDRTEAWLLYAFVVALQVSIAAANVLLALLVVTWVVNRLRTRTWPSAPRFFVPLLVYCGWTLVASAMSIDPRASFIDDKQLVLFVLVPIVYDVARGRRAASVVDTLITIGAISAAVGIVQYAVLHYDNLGRRPEGALTHYMTYSGILMLVICAAAGRLLFGARDRAWSALVMPALVVALSMTLTRNAWIGAAAGVAVLFLLHDFRLAALLPLAVAAIVVFTPAQMTERMLSTFDAKDPATQDRFAMLEIGARITRDHPLTGVGPNMVERIYPQYRPDYAINATNPHLHNVPMQMMAERGIPALVAWLAFVVTLWVGLLRLFRRGERLLPATGLAALTAMLAAGLFEHNFGDSEFLMTFLVLVTLPFAARRDDSPRAAAAARA